MTDRLSFLDKMRQDEAYDLLHKASERLGYRFEERETADGFEVRMIRPDGTVAMVAKKKGPRTSLTQQWSD